MAAVDSYDLVRYPSPTFPQTHPDRLAVAGLRAGLEPAAPGRCRYLEIGCGTGINILGMATTLPDSEFLGIDLAGAPIAEATAAASELGLGNARFVRGDVCALGAEIGDFDYIVAHGVYSWVPAPVRDGIMELCRQRLRPQGIAYISYNTYPGCHARELVRRMMRFHVRAVEDPMQRVEQGRALIQFLASAGAGPEPYGQILAKELAHLQSADPGLIFHDDLAEVNDPCYFHEFVAHAARHGLQFLAEAAVHEMQDKTFAPSVVAALAQLDDDLLTKEQYLDFLKGRRFRQSLLCRSSLALDRREAPLRALERLRFATDAELVATAADAPAGAVTYRRSNKAEATTSSPVAIAALRALVAAWPLTLPFAALAPTPGARAELAPILHDLVGIGLIDARLTEVPCVAAAGPRPTASRFARYQAARGEIIGTLRHQGVRLEDAAIRALLVLMDGERDHAALADGLAAEVAAGRVPAPPGAPTTDMVAVRRAITERLPHLLRHAARLALVSA